MGGRLHGVKLPILATCRKFSKYFSMLYCFYYLTFNTLASYSYSRHIDLPCTRNCDSHCMGKEIVNQFCHNLCSKKLEG